VKMCKPNALCAIMKQFYLVTPAYKRALMDMRPGWEYVKNYVQIVAYKPCLITQSVI